MQISVIDAKGQLTELFGRAEQGDEVVLTRHGRAVARLVPVKPPLDRKSHRGLIEEIQASARPSPGPSAARSQDFLYGDYGLPK